MRQRRISYGASDISFNKINHFPFEEHLADENIICTIVMDVTVWWSQADVVLW